MFSEDLFAYFDVRDFAVLARYDGKVDIPVIFDRAYIEQIGLIAGAGPVALVQATSVDAAAVGKSLVIAGTSYVIRSVEPDGDGTIILLRLETA